MGQVVLALSVASATCFFVARWGINAEGVGRHDAGTALFLSFASVIATYVCAGLAAASLLLGLLAVLRRRPWRVYAYAAAAATLPIVYLAFR